ncbi:Cytochrome P450-like protein 88 [Elsinoe fawcettii]|nr:Cytochrome P450-like protein 88 [Elsinoe fawcettii]
MDSHQPFQAIVDSPLLYISRLPSKHFRVHLLEALNTWYEIPANDMSRVSDILQLLHNCSLILDDFQDRSPLRRGRPAAHALFGEAQAINSSSYGFVKAVALAQESFDLESTKAVTTAMLRSFEGQAAELYWTYTKTCPSVQEYLDMVDLKTGSLLHLAPQLMRAKSRSTIPLEESSMVTLMRVLGQFYQIRDDYMNLTSAQYEKNKGFCEDLDEAKVIQPLSEETEFALDLNFGQSGEWYTITLKPAILDIIARISSRIYLGDELCRNTEWLAVTKVYTSAFFAAPVKLALFPAPLRRLAHWFIPECKILREQVQEARRIIGPIVHRRQALQAKALSEGCPAPQFHDALGWAAEESAKNGMDYDPAVTQLALSMLAIHTTYDLFQQCILDLAQNPHFIEPLRQEALEVVRQHGWTKQGLYHMKLLDSALKETQRLKPGSMVTMRRYVLEDLQLSNGLLLKKGTRINIDTQRMRDPDLHEDPRTYDAFRFHKMRQQPGGEHTAQLVSTSQDHLGFGHGEHSCPGRFFAANEIKVAMAHMLINYEWKPAENSLAGPDVKGLLMKSGAGAQIDIRRRVAVATEGSSI